MTASQSEKNQMSVRAQPFTPYHKKICSDTMLFWPPWMCKLPRDVDLRDEADCKPAELRCGPLPSLPCDDVWSTLIVVESV